ncbi:hypothetical protein [Xanthomonas prunicola]|uniref:hypothetical protein n=1 Tax=Xanthomonas prunicola TaxID=2053930 RepID=UPI001FB00FDE|nr:hypothetical protein [Xanthomonas prunicola]
MKHLVTAAIAMAALSGCATVMNDATQPIRVDTKTADGQLIAGADCSISNDKGRVALKSGQTAQVHRSAHDLDVTCVLPGQRAAAGRSISRANMGIWGNILIGGAIGAIVDHTKGTGYTYPSWIQLVFGQTLSFDRHREDRGQPLQGENAPGVVVAAHAASGSGAHNAAVTLPLANEPAVAMQTGVAAAPVGAASNLMPAGPSMSTEPAAIRAQSISSGLQCGTVQATSATRFSAVCSSGNTVQIDCSGFRCTSTFQ